MNILLLLSAALAGTLCNDGWVSPSSGSGTCSHHGGIAEPFGIPSTYDDSEGRAQAKEIATGFCRSLLNEVQTLACLRAVSTQDFTVATSVCTREDASALSCLEGLRVRLAAEKEWLETHPPEPPPDPTQRAREIYAQRFGTSADVERLKQRATYDKMMKIPPEKAWMVIPTFKLFWALKELGAPPMGVLVNSDTMPTILRFLDVGTCVTYSDYFKTLSLSTASGNVVTASAYGTRSMSNTDSAHQEYARSRREAMSRGHSSGEFCITGQTEWPWEN